MANIPPVSELYKVIRAQIDTTSGDMGQRIIWLAIGQSFFFSAYAILSTGKPPLPENMDLYKAMLLVLPIIALVYTLLTFLDVLASLSYIVYLRHHYENIFNDEEADKDYPPVHGTKTIRLFLHTSPAILPVVFFVIWSILLYIHLHPK